MGSKFGQWAFIAGVLIAAVVGVFSAKLSSDTLGMLVLALVILGLVVGFLNVSEKETTAFLVASAALLITNTAGVTLAKIPTVGDSLAGVVNQIGVFVAPAAILVALKAIWALAKD